MPWLFNLVHKFVLLIIFVSFQTVWSHSEDRKSCLSFPFKSSPPLPKTPPRRTKARGGEAKRSFCLFFLLSLHVCLSITLVFGYDFWTVANKLWRIGYKTNVHTQLLNVLKIKVHVIRSNPVFVWLSVGNP